MLSFFGMQSQDTQTLSPPQPFQYWLAGGNFYYYGYTGALLAYLLLCLIYSQIRRYAMGSIHLHKEGEPASDFPETNQGEKDALLGETQSAHEARLTYLGLTDDDEQDELYFQLGYKSHRFGTWLRHSFTAFVVVSNVFLFLLSAFSYDWVSYQHPDTEVGRVKWDDIAYAWLYVCVLYHAVLLSVIYYQSELASFLLNRCPLNDAEYVKIRPLNLLNAPGANSLDLSPDIRRYMKKIYNSLRKSQKAPVLVKVETTPEGLRYFNHTVIRYLWSESRQRFCSTGFHSISGEGAHQVFKNGGHTQAKVRDLLKVNGRNEIVIEKMTCGEAIFLEYSTFLNLFQLFATWQYFFYGGWNMAGLYFILAMASGLYRALYIVRKNQHKTADMALLKEEEISVLRENQVVSELTVNLVNGDIVGIKANWDAPCDILLMDGFCVVNENSLTGEARPVQKFVAQSDKKTYESALKKSASVIYAGSTVMTSTKTDGGLAWGYVLATGSRSVRGSMVRTILFPPQHTFSYDQDLGTVYLLLLLWILFQMFFLNVVLKLLGVNTPAASALFAGLSSLTQVLSPVLPVALSLGVSTSVQDIQKKPEEPELGAIGCTNPERLPVAAKVDLAVFDKTGTITEGGMIFQGVFHEGQWVDDIQNGSSSSSLLLTALATNHTVTQVKGELIGNEVDVSVVDFFSIHIPEAGQPRVIETMAGRYMVVKAHPFDNQRQLSSVIARNLSSREVYFFVKGSEDSISQLVKSNIKDDARTLERGSFYALGVCMRVLDVSQPDSYYESLTLDELLRGPPLHFLGFSCFSNPMKPDSPECFRLLKEGNIRTLICSGDAVIACIQIAKQVNLFEKPIVEIRVAQGNLIFIDAETEAKMDPKTMRFGDHQFAVSQEAFNLLESQKLLGQYLEHILVFGRMKPHDKVAIVRKFQNRKLITSMCGDGANDSAALRMADVGLALTDGDASLVAPFSTSSPSLLNFVRLLTFGRSTLVSSISLFTVSVTIGLMMTTTKVLTIARGDFYLAEWHYVLFDLMQALGLTFTMTRSQPLKILAPAQPTANLLGSQQLMTVLGFLLIYWVFYLCGWFLLHSQAFYVFHDTNVMGIPTNLMVKKGDNYDTAWTFLIFCLSLSTFGYVLSYGGQFRQNVLKNYSINLLLLGSLVFVGHLLWSGPSNWHCWWRVQCDHPTALKFWFPVIEQLSVGDPKGCFLNSHVMMLSETKLHDFMNKCLEPAKYGGHPPSIDPEILPIAMREAMQHGADHCEYPNTCFPTYFKLIITGLLVVYMLSLHLFYHYIIMKPLPWVRGIWPYFNLGKILKTMSSESE